MVRKYLYVLEKDRMTKEEIRNLALFIDFENYSHDISFDAKALFEMLNLPKEGRFVIKRAYSDWGRFSEYKRQMLENSIDLIEMPSHNSRGKNAVDMKLTVDALEIAITKDYIDTFVIVSGDSDYTPLLSKLREYNKYVIVIGNSKSSSKLLAGYCDEIIYYSSLVNDEVEVSNLNNAYKLLSSSCKYLKNEGIVTRGSLVKSRIKQIDSSFSESEYGFRQWRLFLEQAKEDGVVTLESLDDGEYLIHPLDDRNVEVGENKNKEHLLYKICPLLLQALKEAKAGSEMRVLFSRINDTLRRLEPTFSITQYGVSRSQGFSGFMRGLSEKGLVELHRKGHDYFASPTPKLEEFVKSLSQPFVADPF